ncbi:hypothetical protein MMC12_008397 [Toensbergia leucococca]|nr:hypothetical protein [Toensbergia leucococca]
MPPLKSTLLPGQLTTSLRSSHTYSTYRKGKTTIGGWPKVEVDSAQNMSNTPNENDSIEVSSDIVAEKPSLRYLRNLFVPPSPPPQYDLPTSLEAFPPLISTDHSHPSSAVANDSYLTLVTSHKHDQNPEPPSLILPTGDVDWSAYHSWTTSPSHRTRLESNVLLIGSVTKELSAKATCDCVKKNYRNYPRALIIIKYFPVIMDGDCVDREVWILAYDLRKEEFVLTWFKSIPESALVWDEGEEVLRIGLVEVAAASATPQEQLGMIMPEWTEEVGLKVCVLLTTGQFLRDFRKGFRDGGFRDGDFWDGGFRTLHRLLKEKRKMLMLWAEKATETWCHYRGLGVDVDTTSDAGSDAVTVIHDGGESNEKETHGPEEGSDLCTDDVDAITHGPSLSDEGNEVEAAPTRAVAATLNYEDDDDENWASLLSWARKPPKALTITHPLPNIPTPSPLASQTSSSPSSYFSPSPPAHSLRCSKNPSRATVYSSPPASGSSERPPLTELKCLENALREAADMDALFGVYRDFLRRYPGLDTAERRERMCAILVEGLKMELRSKRMASDGDGDLGVRDEGEEKMGERACVGEMGGVVEREGIDQDAGDCDESALEELFEEVKKAHRRYELM